METPLPAAAMPPLPTLLDWGCILPPLLLPPLPFLPLLSLLHRCRINIPAVSTLHAPAVPSSMYLRMMRCCCTGSSTRRR